MLSTSTRLTGLTVRPPSSDRDIARPTFMIIALLPPMIAGFILWCAPVTGLTADRTAIAARDFTVLWAAGQLAASHAFAALSDPAALTAFIRDIFGAGMPQQLWPYPPTALLIAAPISQLPFASGFLLYAAVTALLLCAALRLGGVAWPACIAVTLSPAVADTVLTGQNGALTAALLIGGLLTIDRRPLLAGLLLGALVIKPQLGLLLPVCLIAGHRWRAMSAAVAMVATLILLSLLLFGLQAWTDYAVRTTSAISAYIEAPFSAAPQQLIFASAFMAARSLGAGLPLAYALQATVTLLCAAAAGQIWRTPNVDRLLRTAATATLALLACPWVHGYDMPALAAAIVLLYPRIPRASRPILAWAWLWPGTLALIAVPNMVSFLTIGSIAWLAHRHRGQSA